MSLRFIQPGFLLVIPFFIVALVAGYYYFGNRRSRKLRYLVFRCIIGTLLLLALSGVRFQWSNRMTTTIFLVDVSDSVSEYRAEMEDYLKQTISNKTDENQIGIITFGKNATIEQFVSEKQTFTGFTSNPVVSSTNIESAINTGITMLPENSAKRIVLITDGEENVGTFQNISSSIKAKNIDFQVLMLDKKDGPEVYVQNLNLPDKISVGDTFQINVEVMSNIACNAKIYLYAGRTLKATESVTLQKGNNNFVFTDTQSEYGMKNYKAVVEAEQDEKLVNNEYSAFTTVDTKPRILVIEGSKGEASEFEKLLTSLQTDYIVGTPSIAPSTIPEMNEYSGIVLVNVHADDLNKGFMDNIQSYLSDYGGGLIAIGGDNSFALGNYKNTALEKVLPVDMELKGEKEIPKMAIALVIDHSGSMAGDGEPISKLTLAKEAAIKALDTLRDTDEIGILEFSDTYSWVAKLQTSGNKEGIEELINGITVGGGTSIYPAVSEAVSELEKSDAKIKHIILLTDGQDGYKVYDDVIAQMNDSNITLSTVSVGQDADTGLLEQLANEGNGRSYHTDITTNIPRIFAQEIFLSVKEYLVNREFVPTIVNNSVLLSGVTDNGLPSLLGYIASTPKETAKVLLESDEEDPILSVMQVGLGRTVAWNSDVTNEWTANYAGQDFYATLWSHLIDWVITDTASESSGVSVTESSGSLTVTYTTEDFNIDSDVSVICTGEDGNSQEVKLSAISPGTYSVDIPLDQAGIYSLNVRESLDGTIQHSVTTGAAVQYSKEYQFSDNSTYFKDAVKQMGGKFISKEDSVFTRLKKERGSRDLTNLCILIALAFFLYDIADRRLNLIFRKKRKKRKEKVVEKAVSVEHEIVIPNSIEQYQEPETKPAAPEKPAQKKQEKQILDTSSLLDRKKNRNQW